MAAARGSAPAAAHSAASVLTAQLCASLSHASSFAVKGRWRRAVAVAPFQLPPRRTAVSSSARASASTEADVPASAPSEHRRPRDAGSLFGSLPERKKDLGAVSPAHVGRFYQRFLPKAQIPFSSDEGRRLFKEALAAGYMENYFHLAEQFRTQDEPTFCGLTTLTMALNSLRIDPMRTWKGAWRWYSEDMLGCCFGPERVRAEGMSFDMFRSLAGCHGALVADHRAPTEDEAAEVRAAFADAFRDAVKDVCSSLDREVLVVCYSREQLGQSGAGHFSPIGGYHPQSDSVLILDVARFKYPPHWAPLQDVVQAMQCLDPDTGRSRGFLHLRSHRQESGRLDDLRPLYLPFVPTAAGKKLSEALAAQLEAQCRVYNGSWESWPVVAMRRWLQAASVAEPQVLRQLLQVGDAAALREVLHRLNTLEIYRDLCKAYGQIIASDGAPVEGFLAEFPRLRFSDDSQPEVLDTEDLSLDTCGELWVLLLLLLPAHLRAGVAIELAAGSFVPASGGPLPMGVELSRAIAGAVRGPWALPLEALREALALLLPRMSATACASPLR